MSHRIYYFSGTGNSLWVARKMQESCPEAELIPITNDLMIELEEADSEPNAESNSEADSEADSEAESESDIGGNEKTSTSGKKEPEIIGLVFPIYFFKPARIVMNFIQKMPNADYVYAVATCGGNPGNTLTVVKNAMLKRGITLRAGYNIVLITNFVVLPNIKSQKSVEKAFKKAEAKTQTIAVHIKNRALHFDKETPKVIQKPLSALAFNPIYRRIPTLDKYFKVSEACVSCGACRDVCPVQNITLNEKPIFHHQCEMCFSCINWCPKKAINWTAATKKSRRYHCQSISKEDVIANRYFRMKKE